MDMYRQLPICWNMLFCRFHERCICKFKHPIDLPLNKIKQCILEEKARTTSVYEFRLKKLNDALDCLNVDDQESVAGTSVEIRNDSENTDVVIGDVVVGDVVA